MFCTVYMTKINYNPGIIRKEYCLLAVVIYAVGFAESCLSPKATCHGNQKE